MNCTDKATWPDNIPGRLLKEAAEELAPRGYKTWVQSQTQNKAQWLAACGHALFWVWKWTQAL